jgi:hypothetical protein
LKLFWNEQTEFIGTGTDKTGYTFLRRWRYGLKGDGVHTKTDYRNDNFYFKAGVEYRLHFR